MPLPRVGFHWARRISVALVIHSLDPYLSSQLISINLIIRSLDLNLWLSCGE